MASKERGVFLPEDDYLRSFEQDDGLDRAIKDLEAAATARRWQKRAVMIRDGFKSCAKCEGTGQNIHDSQSIDCPACDGFGLVP